jgi:hypothetical protein
MSTIPSSRKKGKLIGLPVHLISFYYVYVTFTYLLTPCSRVLLEKLTVNFAASQEIPRIYGTRKFLAVPTTARHLSLSWTNSIQSPRPPPTSWRSILILSSHLRRGLPNDLFPSGFPTNTLCTPLSFVTFSLRKWRGVHKCFRSLIYTRLAKPWNLQL